MAVPHLAILGPGLLGGSVALAARKFNCAGNVHLWGRRDAAIADIKRRGIADLASTDLAEIVAGADLIVLATPVGVMADLVAQLLGLPLTSGVLITDLGSVKGSVVSAVDSLLDGRDDVHFVGSHPMAGKERTGIEHATAELFQGAACVVTPGKSSTPESVCTIENFWQKIGCHTTRMEPDQHDGAVARVSHLPHLAASLIATTALGNDPADGKVAGAGLRDTTRIASGSPSMWAEILLENQAAIVPALSELAGMINQSLALLEGGDREKLESLLEEAKFLRDALPAASSSDDVD